MNTPQIHPALERRPLWPEKSTSPPIKNKEKATGIYLLRLIFLLILLLTVIMAGANVIKTNNDRQRVAVVLSGGGTKGMAHIGVLKALEDHDIPIDYIAGTSIGAIIGGMYAAGYTPEEIEALVVSEEFKNAAVGHIDDQYRQFYLEPRPDPSWFNLYFSWEDRLEPQNVLRQNIPANIVSPYLMDFLFMEYLGPPGAAANFHFDNLYIPFRCIVTEVEGRRAVTMRDGSLPDAVRASMTFPFYFQPIEIGGKLMMDGGMFNNFPVNVVLEEFQPDVIIGSVVSDNPKPPQRDNIISQLENLLKHPTLYEVPEGIGVVIKPDVPDIAVNDMRYNAELIGEGYHAAIQQLDLINTYVSTRINADERNTRRNTFRESIPGMIIGDIRISGLNREQKQHVLQALDYRNLPMPIEQVKQNYLCLLLNNRFDYVYPYLRYDNHTGHFVFSLEMEKRREFLRSIGGNISSRPVNHLFAKVEYARWGANPLTLRSKLYFGNFYNSLEASARLDFPGEAPFYLETRSTYSRWEYARSSVFLFEEQDPPFLKQREMKDELLISYPIDNHQKFTFAAAFAGRRDEFFNTRNFSELDTMDRSTLRSWLMEACFEKSTLNRKQYPTKGNWLYTSFRVVYGLEEHRPGSTSLESLTMEKNHAWIEVLARYKNFFRTRSQFNPGFSAEAFLSQRPAFRNYTSTLAMAQQYSPFPIATTMFLPEFRANNYVAAGLKSIFDISSNASIQAEAHLFQPIRNITASEGQKALFEEYHFKPRPMSNLALVYHTPPGPLSLSMSYFHNENEAWVFMINFGFILFNKQAFM